MKSFMLKKRLLTIAMCLGVVFMSNGQKITEDNMQHLQVTFSVPQVEIGKTIINGQEFSQLNVEGMQSSAQVGAPNLPTWSALIEVPVCSGYDVVVKGVEYDTLQCGLVVPVQP